MKVSEIQEKIEPTLVSTTNLVKTLWLILLYSVLLFFVLGTLTTYQFRQRVQSEIEDAGESSGLTGQNVDNIVRQVRSEAQVRIQIEELRSERDRYSQRISEAAPAITSLSQDRTEIFSELNQLDSTFFDTLDNELELMGIPDNVIFELDTPAAYRDYWSNQGLELASSNLDNESAIIAFEGYLTAYEDSHSSITARIESFDNRFGYAGFSEIDELESSRTETVELINTLEDQSRYVEEDNVVFQNLSAELAALSSLCFPLTDFCIDDFVSQHSSILVLLLTLSMGTLGSTIVLTQEVLDQNVNMPLPWIFTRPLLGMATSISIYILAKAGQLTLETGSESDTLNPFIISFLAIISGLLAEDSVDKISDAGRRFLNKKKIKPKSEPEHQAKDTSATN